MALTLIPCQVSPATWEQVKQSYTATENHISVKGKGEMVAYLIWPDGVPREFSGSEDDEPRSPASVHSDHRELSSDSPLFTQKRPGSPPMKPKPVDGFSHPSRSPIPRAPAAPH